MGVNMTECTKCRQTREAAKTVAKIAVNGLSNPKMIVASRGRLKECESCPDIVRWYGFMQGTQATVTVKDKCSHRDGCIVDYVSNEKASCPGGRW